MLVVMTSARLKRIALDGILWKFYLHSSYHSWKIFSGEVRSPVQIRWNIMSAGRENADRKPNRTDLVSSH